MNLYLLTMPEDELEWRAEGHQFVYDSAVVAAPSEEAARHMHPGSMNGLTYSWGAVYDIDTWRVVAHDGSLDESGTDIWVAPEQVDVRLLGKAAPGIGPGVIINSHVGE